MKWKERFKMGKLWSLQSLFKRHYENVRINSIIEEWSKWLIEKQNVHMKARAFQINFIMR